MNLHHVRASGVMAMHPLPCVVPPPPHPPPIPCPPLQITCEGDCTCTATKLDGHHGEPNSQLHLFNFYASQGKACIVVVTGARPCPVCMKSAASPTLPLPHRPNSSHTFAAPIKMGFFVCC